MKKNEPEIVLLKGTLRSVTVVDTELDLIFTPADRNAAAATGVAAAAMGLSGLAAGAVDSSVADAKLPMKQVRFELEGQLVEALLWGFPFRDGDMVEAVVEPDASGYRAYAVACPKSRIIAVYPYSTSGLVAHILSSARIFFYFCLFFILPFCILIHYISVHDGISTPLSVGVGAAVIFGIVGANMSRKFLPFVRIAERIFTTLGFKDVRRINLRRLTKKLRRPDDPPALGDTYFRY